MFTRLADSALLLVVIALAAGCGAPDPAVPVKDPGAPVAFRASSVESTFFAVVGTFEGTYTVEPDGLNVFVSRATVQVRDMGYYDGPRRISALRLGMGYGDLEGKWGMHTRSEPVRIDRMLRPGEEVTLDSLHVFVPFLGQGHTLGVGWIVFQMEEMRTGADGGPPGKATSYAHGPRLDGSAPRP